MKSSHSSLRTDQLIDRHFKSTRHELYGNARWVSAMSWLNPTLAMDQVSMSLAGSDLAHYLHFLNSAEAHRRVMVRNSRNASTKNSQRSKPKASR